MILLFSPGTTVRRSYYAGVIDYGTLQGVALYAERLRRIGHDFFAASWPLLAVFGAVLAAYLLLVWQKENIWKRPAARTKLDGLPVSGIFVLLFVAALSVVAMAAVAYEGDQRRGFEFFWLIVISLTAYLVTEIWNRFSSALVRLLLVLSLLALIMLQASDMARVYARLRCREPGTSGPYLRGTREITGRKSRCQPSQYATRGSLKPGRSWRTWAPEWPDTGV